MVIARPRRGGWLVAELMIAIAVLSIAMIPLAFSFRGEQKLARTHYHQVIAMEIVDGEMEFLQAGHWRNFPQGEHPYTVKVDAATNLPPGIFLLTRTEKILRLEWRPQKKKTAPAVSREISLLKN